VARRPGVKVRERTGSRLVIVAGPWLLAFEFALFAVAFISMGTALIWLRANDPGGPAGGPLLIGIGVVILLAGLWRARIVRLEFDGATGQVALTARSVFQHRTQTLPLAEVRRAESFGKSYSVYTMRTQRLGLVYSDGRLAVTNYTSPSEKTAKVAKEINAWLRGFRAGSLPNGQENRTGNDAAEGPD
jgi:hypothetical protein